MDVLSKITKRKYFKLRAYGTSMYPLLQDGDTVFVRKSSTQALRENDIVLAQKGNKFLIHRIIYLHKKKFVLKGDHNAKHDGIYQNNNIVGKVNQIKRKNQMIDLTNYYLMQSSQYFHEISKIVHSFTQVKIEYLILKGLPLHLFFEKTHPRRVYADCDILVKMRDSEKIQKLFTKLGYSKVDSAYSPIHRLMKNKKTEESYVKKINSLPIVFDIHYEPVFLMNQIGRMDALFPQKLIDEMTDDFFKTKKKITVEGKSFFILDSSFLILYLCLHFFHHNFQGIHRLEFIDKVIRHTIKMSFPRRRESKNNKLWIPNQVRNDKYDFKNIQVLIRKYQVQNFVWPVFMLLKKYYKTPLPKEFLNQIKPNSSITNYLSPIINYNESIFNDEPRVGSGVRRFMLIFLLSPHPLWKKLFIFISPAVIFSIKWVMYKKLMHVIKQNN